MSKKTRRDFFMIDNDYIKLYAKHLGVVATAVFNSLNMHADIDGKCFPSMELIGEQHGIDRHTVSRALKKLEDWNIISTERAINRKLKKRKNNIYKLLPKELWRKILIEDLDEELGGYCNDDDLVLDENNFWVWNSATEENGKEDTINKYDKSNGNNDTIDMASKIPNIGTEDTSNNTHITKPKEENSLCGQEPTKTDRDIPSTKASFLSADWSSNKAIQDMIKSGYKDYQIIGSYFDIKHYSFENKPLLMKAIKRSLKAAKLLQKYTVEDIRNTMVWIENKEFEMGWSLEVVSRYIDDCISSNFIAENKKHEEMTELKITMFNAFWNAYPKKVSKKFAEIEFNKLDPNIYSKIMESLENHKKSEQWQNIEYTPLAGNWLKNERFEDEVTISNISPMERYAKECIKKWPLAETDNASFMFTKKYPDTNDLFKVRHIIKF